MASVGQGATIEEDRSGAVETPPALRIDTDVFATLTETVGEQRDGAPSIVAWFDCWRS
ncbi:hypothetical protein [Haloarcula onubensis]|uniref:Uncharacterized protein n=1 Tax=Haloarcula onubensis TaxID=2950539 RepID=A0ABU2FS07_9EURY|nr:hypothetical protein [Halomicroarcula sp. S3CR25-11]MDS0283027.1 hypothetical protein [Halomicroarcula sp. S3CR25-11]